jgi:hypothetical protein
MILEELSMFKIGDIVEVKGGEFSGQKGTIIGACKIAKPGEPQEPAWAVKLSHGTYKFYEEQLKLVTH